MRTLGTTAIYKEKEYEFRIREDGTYAIYSTERRDIENGFHQINVNINRYMKIIDREELDFVFHKKTVVVYKGDEFLGSVIEGSKIMLYTDDLELKEKYNMIMRDRWEYYLYVDLWEVDEIIQKWTPLRKYHNQ